ncbi:facilitated trehalose transporter Tret1-2 homolog isoform X1 [Cloeon dipterum]|uniref:facilitated trehalose transporter Tret1-2 homolog isoform X1 n=2 Tax=Cloeon dipterum TaxID=197152 RepID=UPI00321FEE6F
MPPTPAEAAELELETDYCPVDSDHDEPITYKSVDSVAGQHPHSTLRVTLVQLLIALGTSLSMLSPGMALGFSAVALPTLDELGIPGKVEPFDENTASWFASISNIATPVGCLASAWTLERLGRKWTLVLLNVPCVLGWVLLASAGSLWQLFAGRVGTGLAVGLASAVTNVYMAEVVQPHMRGLLLCWNSISIALGILIVYVLGSAFPWQVAAWSGAAAATVALLVSLALPESPAWLVGRGRRSQAERSLAALRGGAGPNVRVEFDELLRAQQGKPDSQGWRNLSKALRTPQFWKPLLILNVFFFFQQASGVYVVIFYAVDVVQEAGVTMDKYLATVLIGVARLVATAGVSVAMSRCGRRPLAIVSGLGMAACMLALAGHLQFAEGAASWVPATAVLGYILTSTLGLLTLPWVMVGELFPADLRGVGGGLTTCNAYLIGFVVLKAYPAMRHALSAAGLFLVYGLVALLSAAFTLLWLPETAGKTLAQVEQNFARRRATPRPPLAI